VAISLHKNNFFKGMEENNSATYSVPLPFALLHAHNSYVI
jgi:hypothetical protein